MQIQLSRWSAKTIPALTNDWPLRIGCKTRCLYRRLTHSASHQTMIWTPPGHPNRVFAQHIPNWPPVRGSSAWTVWNPPSPRSCFSRNFSVNEKLTSQFQPLFFAAFLKFVWHLFPQMELSYKWPRGRRPRPARWWACRLAVWNTMDSSKVRSLEDAKGISISCYIMYNV